MSLEHRLGFVGDEIVECQHIIRYVGEKQSTAFGYREGLVLNVIRCQRGAQ